MIIPPSHEYKQEVIAQYKEKYKYDILIETGTYEGDMVESQKRRFKKILSIELGDNLYLNAVDKFKNDENVSIIHGDSGKVLSEILNHTNESAIFWLDGHYSGGITALGEKQTPIVEELDAIFKHKNMKHVILIDDARCFLKELGYPTIPELKELIENNNYHVDVINDIIRCEPYA